GRGPRGASGVGEPLAGGHREQGSRWALAVGVEDTKAEVSLIESEGAQVVAVELATGLEGPPKAGARELHGQLRQERLLDLDRSFALPACLLLGRSKQAGRLLLLAEAFVELLLQLGDPANGALEVELGADASEDDGQVERFGQVVIR